MLITLTLVLLMEKSTGVTEKRKRNVTRSQNTGRNQVETNVEWNETEFVKLSDVVTEGITPSIDPMEQ